MLQFICVNYSNPNTSKYTNKVLKLKLNLWSSLHPLFNSSLHLFLPQNFGFMWQLNQKIKKTINYTFKWLKYFLTRLSNLFASLRHKITLLDLPFYLININNNKKNQSLMELYLAYNKNLRKILKPGCKFYTFCNWSLHLLKSSSH